ncbi:MAG: type II toxin-antitoxin system YafQ family toxin [Bacteroidaceae bacterium]|nr:type II toxin-antitoxin system YafQ family toxin [Bacteroidaceae bacterium]MBR3897287.1 type II toxin-antitoxin system YafQ family toxin [Bacteroidaceae bacterium]
MKTIKYSSQFKKDFKKYRNDKAKVEKLLEVFRMLENEIELPERYKLHKLVGNYKGCWECHIDGDFLLIWIDETSQTIKVVRLGSHSELF